MHRLILVTLAAGMALIACSGTDDPVLGTGSQLNSSSVPAVTTTSVASVVDDTSPSSASTVVSASTTTVAAAPQDTISDADLTTFIAAVEAALVGTDQAGVVYDAPEIYIALAQVACARFTDGETFDEVAQDMLDELADAGSTDEERLVGAILGAATRTICPEHADKV